MNEFYRVPVGRGTPEGVNSAYVLPDRNVVIDPGPPTEEAWKALLLGVEGAGLEVGAVEHVMVTHWHTDHAGLAPRFAEEAGATLFLHDDDAPLVGDYATARPERLDRDARTLARWGVPDAVRDALLRQDTPSAMPDTYPVESMTDRETVSGVKLVHTPGHTKGHASFVTEETLFLGDVLLPTYTPNVGGSDTRLNDPLATYLTSLEKVEALATSRTGEPGHGTTMSVREAAAEVRKHHRERARASFDIAAAGSEPTAWTVARELFGEMDGIHAKFGAGEAAAHLDRLAALDIVERIEDTPVRYRTLTSDYPSSTNLMP